MYLKRTIRSVYLMPGFSCNLSCRYCLQGQHAEGERGETNPGIYCFLAELARGNPRLRVVFYGGEPLVYFSAMRETAEYLPDLNYSVITNGRLLDAETVEWLNSRRVSAAVSWDGRASIHTRGYDVMAANRENVLRLDRLCLTGVVSAAAYPRGLLADFQTVADEYEQIHGHPPSVNLDTIMDTGFWDKSLLDMDYSRVRSEVRGLTLEYLDALERGRDGGVAGAYIGSIVHTAERFYASADAQRLCTVSCGNGLTTLNLDLQGNLYPCHNSAAPAGNIRSDFFDYLGRILETDGTRERRAECANCPALPICRGGCKLVSDSARNAGYCDLKRAVYGTVIETAAENAARIAEMSSSRKV